MSTFADHFWGEKNNGFYVLYHNMKNGQTSSKELLDFLRESCQVEESYSRLLTKLAKNTSNNSHNGTFAPFWNVLKSLVEKLANLHMQLVHTWSDLIKDIVRYNEEQHKRHKAMKESEAGTLEVVQSIQHTNVALHKAKEIYHTRCLELERLRRENASQKDLEKAETKYKKACDEYKSLIDKYAGVRNDFEKKMTTSCTKFQELEEEHISQMKDFIDTYARSWENEHVVLGQAYSELKRSSDEMTIQKLIQSLIEQKTTGTKKPGPLEFVEVDLTSVPNPRPMSPEPNDKRDSLSDKQKQDAALFSDSSGTPSPVLSDQPGPLSRSVKLRVSRTWFLKSKPKKKEKKKKRKDKDEKDSESIDSENKDDGPAPEVDEEGYIIRPETTDNNGDKNSWYSSDSDTDSDGDDSRRKINVKIRPLSPNGATPTGTVEDIKASVEGLRLSPTAAKRRSQTPIDKKMKKSLSESDTLDAVKPSHDLLNLDLLASSSSASTPTGGLTGGLGNYNLPSPLSPQTQINWNSASPSAVTSPSSATFNDLLSHDVSGSSTGRNTPSVPSQVSSPLGGVSLPAAIARPPSRNKGILAQAKTGQNSPIPLISRSESASSVTFNTTSMPIGSSRGPSPLTIGMSDTVPLAVAFTETINAYFKGHDATKSTPGEDSSRSRCVVKMTGNLMMSFPAGIVKAFTENPSPAVLNFRIKNAAKIEQVMPNTQLLERDTAQSTSDCHVFQFDMQALTEHLRQQGEQNKTASYFNIDIIKYQVRSVPGVGSTPLPLVVYWKCEDKTTEYRLDYQYNAPAMAGSATLKNVNVAVNISGGVTKMQSIPPGHWNEENNRATWKLNDISEVSEQESQGCIRSKFELKSGPSIPSTTALQFMCDGSTLSGVDFELVGPGYRISLAKKRFATGKYYVDPEPDSKDV